jgi:hypothetical protein
LSTPDKSCRFKRSMQHPANPVDPNSFLQNGIFLGCTHLNLNRTVFPLDQRSRTSLAFEVYSRESENLKFVVGIRRQMGRFPSPILSSSSASSPQIPIDKDNYMIYTDSCTLDSVSNSNSPPTLPSGPKSELNLYFTFPTPALTVHCRLTTVGSLP